jgi:hypothetical protein
VVCVVCLREGVPLYLYRASGDARSYIWREACTPPPLHVKEAPTHEGVAEQRRQGVAAPWDQSGRSLTEPPRHRLCVVGHMLDMGCVTPQVLGLHFGTYIAWA